MLSPIRAAPENTGGIKWAGPLMAVIVLQTAAAFLLQFLPTTAPILMHNLGWSESAIGYLMALTMGSAIICLQGAGSVVRRLGPVRAVQAGLMVGSLGALALAAPIFVAPLVACLLIGLAYGPATPAGSDILHRFSPPRHRSLVFSVKQAGVPLGSAAAGLALPWLVVTSGWLAAIGCTILVMIAAVLFAQPFRHLADGDRSTRLATGNGTGGPRSFLLPLGTLRQGTGLPRLASVGGCLAIVQGVLNAFLVTWMVNALSFDLHAAGLAFAVLQSGGIAGRLGFGWLADRLESGVPIMRISALGSIATLLVLSAMRPEWPFALVLVCCGAAGIVAAGWNGVQLSEIARRTPAGLIGETAAGATSAVFLGLVAGPALFGLALAQTGRFDVAFAAFAFFPAVALALSLTVPRTAGPISSS